MNAVNSKTQLEELPMTYIDIDILYVYILKGINEVL